jgi:hypothetical protein
MTFDVRRPTSAKLWSAGVDGERGFPPGLAKQVTRLINTKLTKKYEVRRSRNKCPTFVAFMCFMV